MKFFVILGKDRHPIANQIFTEEDLIHMTLHRDWTLVPIEAPWQNAVWNQVGGRGHSAYPSDLELTTIRVPKAIAPDVKRFSIWRSTLHHLI